jgi:hypothetical protein
MILTRKNATPTELRELRREVAELRAERDALQAQLDGDIPRATYWLQTKVWRQRRALDRLERRQLSIRFALRLMNELREPVTAEEWWVARNAASLRERLEPKAPTGE